MGLNIKFERPRIYFTGVGGQGTLTATRLLAQAAMDAGVETVAGEVHGMAQRGGVVESFLLLGGWRAPRLDYGEADVILGFEPLETMRGLAYLRPGGVVFSSVDELPPLNVSLGQSAYPPLEEITAAARANAQYAFFMSCREIGLRAGALLSGNTALLGAFCASGMAPFGIDALELAIRRHLPEKIHKANLEAMRLGAECWRAENAGQL